MRSSSLLLTLPAALVLILPEPRMAENAAAIKNPTSEAARHFQLGEWHRKAGRLEQAETHYEAALRLDPGFISAYRYLGETLLRRGQGARAVAVVEKALALERENVDLLILLGVAYGTEGRIEDSIRTLSRATEIDPKLPLPWINLGASLEQQGDWSRAVEAFRMAVRLDPQSAYAHSRLGSLLLRAGQVGEAGINLRRAIELQPGLTEARFHLSDLLKLEGRTAEARDVFMSATGLSLPKAPVSSALLEKGRRLTEQFCASCHLTPSPDTLPKERWPFVTAWMANYLGYPNTAGPFASLVCRDLIPPRPLATRADVDMIFHYLVSAAPENPAPPAAKPVLQEALPFFEASTFDPALPEMPLVTLVKIDEKGRRLFVGEGSRNELRIYSSAGILEHRLPQESQPVALTPDGRGFFLTLMGDFDVDRRRGQVIRVEPDNTGGFTSRPLVRNFVRTAHCLVHDLNGDGMADLVISGFGEFEKGRFSWFENLGGGAYREHVLIGRSGALMADVLDMTGDGRPDVLVLLAQARNELVLFVNQGGGRFERRQIFEQLPGFGYHQFQLADFNRDGKMDVMTVNGNNMEMEDPPLRSYHGIRIYLNDGKLNFSEKFFYPMYGAIKAIAADFRRKGRLDIAAVSFYPDWTAERPEGFVYLENAGEFRFVARTFPGSSRGRWLTMDAGDLDGDGRLDLVLGGAYVLKGIPPGVLRRFQAEFRRIRPVIVLRGRGE